MRPTKHCLLQALRLLAVACFVRDSVAEDVPQRTSPFLSIPSSMDSSCNDGSSLDTRMCPSPHSGQLLLINYPSKGNLQCGDVLSVSQATLPPTVKATRIDPTAWYSLLLVDTTTTIFASKEGSLTQSRPILHYGALNIPGSLLLTGLSLETTQEEVDILSPYHGPFQTSEALEAFVGRNNNNNNLGNDPRAILHTETDGLIWYEFFLGRQSSKVPKDRIPMMDSILRFDYHEFFESIVDISFEDLEATTHFRSGSCVQDPLPEGPQPTEATNVPASQEPSGAPVLSPTEFPSVSSNSTITTNGTNAPSVSTTNNAPSSVIPAATIVPTKTIPAEEVLSPKETNETTPSPTVSENVLEPQTATEDVSSARPRYYKRPTPLLIGFLFSLAWFQ